MSIPPHASGQIARDMARTMRSFLSADHSHDESGSHTDPALQCITEQPRRPQTGGSTRQGRSKAALDVEHVGLSTFSSLVTPSLCG